MRDLLRVIANEWMKLIRRKRFLVTAILSLFVVLLFGGITYHDYQNQLRYSNPLTQAQDYVAVVKTEIAHAQAAPDLKNQAVNLKQLQQQLVNAQNNLKQVEATQTGDWKPALKQQIAFNQGTIQRLQNSKNTQDIAQVQFAKGQLLQLNYNLSHNIRPLGFPAMNAYSSVKDFMSICARIFLPLLVIILVADMVSGEATDGTIKLLLIRPVSRVKILLGKWLVSLFSTFIWSLAVCVAVLLAGFAIMGARGWNQPMLTNVYYTVEKMVPADPMGGMATMVVSHYNHASVMPAWQFTLTGFLYTALSMMVVATIALLCSTVFRSAMVSTAAAMGSIIVGFIVFQMARHQVWVDWLFPTHLSLMDNWSGDLSQSLQQKVGLDIGLVVLGVWAIVALITSLYSFKQRDVLNA